jgi:hypothetical protein
MTRHLQRIRFAIISLVRQVSKLKDWANGVFAFNADIACQIGDQPGTIRDGSIVVVDYDPLGQRCSSANDIAERYRGSARRLSADSRDFLHRFATVMKSKDFLGLFLGHGDTAAT